MYAHLDIDKMNNVISQEDNIFISDGSKSDIPLMGLPLAAVICFVIVAYGIIVLLCLFLRQVVLNRKPVESLRALNCCECLLLWPRPSLNICKFACDQPTKTDALPWRARLEWLWGRVPPLRCRLPGCARCRSACSGSLWRLQCPNSVLCCGLEIRRHATRTPHMVDASVSGGNVLDPCPATPPPAQHQQLTAGDSLLTGAAKHPEQGLDASGRSQHIRAGDSLLTGAAQHPEQGLDASGRSQNIRAGDSPLTGAAHHPEQGVDASGRSQHIRAGDSLLTGAAKHLEQGLDASGRSQNIRAGDSLLTGAPKHLEHGLGASGRSQNIRAGDSLLTGAAKHPEQG